jgi:hypothetical protein
VPQLYSDGWAPCVAAVGASFTGSVDHAQVVKNYSRQARRDDDQRYEPPRDPSITKTPVFGVPDMQRASTSHVERQNLTIRMHSRRFTRLCDGFSQRLPHHKAAVALHIAFYNFSRPHEALRVTPAMEARLTDHVWSIEELVAAALSERDKRAERCLNSIGCEARPICREASSKDQEYGRETNRKGRKGPETRYFLAFPLRPLRPLRFLLPSVDFLGTPTRSVPEAPGEPPKPKALKLAGAARWNADDAGRGPAEWARVPPAGQRGTVSSGGAERAAWTEHVRQARLVCRARRTCRARSPGTPAIHPDAPSCHAYHALAARGSRSGSHADVSGDVVDGDERRAWPGASSIAPRAARSAKLATETPAVDATKLVPDGQMNHDASHRHPP